jgi:hypothetical protein
MVEGLLLGGIAGAVGVVAMDAVGWFLYRREDAAALEQERAARASGLDTAHAAANKMANAVGVNLSPPQPHPLGIAVHYSLGVIPGALFGLLLMLNGLEWLAAGYGLFYGFILYVFQDQLMAPLLGLASGPTKYPWQAHARGLITHLILGVVTYLAFITLGKLV